MTLQDIGIIASLIGTAFAIALAVLMSRPKRLKMDAETSKIFQEMLEKEVKKGITKNKTIQAMAAQIERLEAEVENLCVERDVLKVENTDLREWAEALVKQVVAAEQTPVEMRRRTKT